MSEIISLISNYLYTYILIILLIFGGIYFTFKTKLVQFRLFKEQIKSVTENLLPVYRLFRRLWFLLHQE